MRLKVPNIDTHLRTIFFARNSSAHPSVDYLPKAVEELDNNIPFGAPVPGYVFSEPAGISFSWKGTRPIESVEKNVERFPVGR